MNITKKAARLAGGLVLAALSCVSTPAHADSTGLVNYSAGNCGQWNRQICTGYGQGVPIGLSSLTVAITCEAASPFVVDRTGVGCYLVGINDGLQYLHTGPLFTAGNAAGIANEGTVPFQGYYLCVGAGYSTATGAFQPVQGHVCM